MLSKAVKTKHGKEKKLSDGSLRACIDTKSKRFYRHPNDQEVLEDHGFAAGSEAKIYEGPEVPWVVASADADDWLKAEEESCFSE